MLNEGLEAEVEARSQELEVKAEANSSRPRSDAKEKIVNYACQQSLSLS